jgi:hydrophobe/amphiphile efflux-3 (HAE3) family protein
VGRLADGLSRALVTKRRAVLVALVLVTVLLGAGLPQLAFETSQDTLIDRSSTVAKENRRYQERFGGEAMLVAWTGDLSDLTRDGNLDRLQAIEADLRKTGDFDAVLGPYTALQFAQAQVGIAPGLLTRHGKTELLATEIGRVGQAGATKLSNPKFVDFLLHDPDGSIRPALRDNFPDPEHLLMLVRLEGNTDIADQGQAADEIKAVLHEHELSGFTEVAAGTPTLLQEINDYLQGGMATLGGLAVLAMVVLLLLVFRARWKLLSLGAVLVGCIWAFGLTGWLGIPLTLVTISGFPILLGLGVDFAIQMHSRFEEELAAGRMPDEAVRRSLAHMGPPLLVAMVAAVAGLLALEVSQVPMIRDFGLLLAIGMVTLVAAALTIVPFALVGRELRSPTPPPAPDARERRLERVVLRLVTALRRGTLVVAGLAVVIAGLGIWVEGRSEIETDPEKWIAQDSQAVQDLVGLRDATGFSSEVDILVDADDVTSPEVVAWMQEYAGRQLDRSGDELLRVTSLPQIANKVVGEEATAQDVADLLAIAPQDVRTSFVSADRQSASIVFPVAPISLQERQQLLDDVDAALQPPPGVHATPAGLAVVGVELVDGLEAGRREITLVSLGLVFVWLLVAYRRIRLAVLPLVPVLLAVGLSAIAVHLLGISLTPLTTVASPLAIAISTEFSVLVMARYLEERAAGRDPEDAVRLGGAHIGRAFLASGLTVLGGFAVLVLAPMPLLVDFGVVVSVIVSVALLSCLVVMPALLVRTDPAAGRPGR